MVEVVVVVAIILIVATIVTIVGLGAMKRAKKTESLQNLRKIGQATTLYAVDYDDYLPPYCSVFGDRVVVDGVTDHPMKFWKDVLRHYKLSDDEFYAPLDPNKRVVADARTVPDAVVHAYTSYVHSNGLIKFRQGDLLAMTLSQLPEKGKAVYLLESGTVWVDMNGQTYMQPYDDVSAWGLFFDGHVEAFPKQY